MHRVSALIEVPKRALRQLSQRSQLRANKATFFSRIYIASSAYGSPDIQLLKV